MNSICAVNLFLRGRRAAGRVTDAITSQVPAALAFNVEGSDLSPDLFYRGFDVSRILGERVETCKVIGMKDYLAEPFKPDQFLRKIPIDLLCASNISLHGRNARTPTLSVLPRSAAQFRLLRQDVEPRKTGSLWQYIRGLFTLKHKKML